MTNNNTTPATLETQLDSRIREHGASSAVNDWCTPLYRSWLSSLYHGQDATSVDTRLRLAAGMHSRLAIRDALILSVVTDIDDELGMLDCAANPHEPATVSMLTDALERAFNNPDAQPVRRKADTALAILTAMRHDIDATGANPAYQSQPIATSAYLEWWLNKPVCAVRDAQLALACEPDTTLAAIVLAAVNQGIQPAWAR